MSRRAQSYEKVIFEIIREYETKFYYDSISKCVDNEQYKIKVEKKKKEMVGKAFVSLPEGGRVDYEIRYNRLVNLSERYTLLVPGTKVG